MISTMLFSSHTARTTGADDGGQHMHHCTNPEQMLIEFRSDGQRLRRAASRLRAHREAKRIRRRGEHGATT